MTGRADTKQTQNAQIPLSEMETMDLDFSDAAKSTFGWPDIGEEVSDDEKVDLCSIGFCYGVW